MNNSKKSRKALLSALVALALCFSMFVGTTMAWFTDTASTGVNIITSGNLDMVVEYATQKDVDYDVDNRVYTISNEKWKTLDASTPVFNADAEYEPGYTEVVYFRIVNNGSMALKYKLNAIIVEETPGTNKAGTEFKLSEHLVSYHMTGETLTVYESREAARTLDGMAFLPFLVPTTTLAEAVEAELSSAAALSYEYGLEPTQKAYTSMVIHMPETVGNEANHNGVDKPEIKLGINFVATQDMFEEDSFGDDYDEKAEYPVVVDTAAALTEALNNAPEGAEISLASDVDYGTVTVDELKNVTINGAEGATAIIKTDADTVLENVTLSNFEFAYTGAAVDCGVVINQDAKIENLVIENTTFTGTGAKAGRGISGFNNAASIVIRNCEFVDLGYPIYAWGGYESMVIEDCTFKNIKSWAIMPQSGFDGDLTVNNCVFKDCLGGGLIKAGTLTAGHTFTFTNNTIEGCTIAGDHNWFQFNVSAGTCVLENNIKDGAEWTPTAADGLK